VEALVLQQAGLLELVVALQIKDMLVALDILEVTHIKVEEAVALQPLEVMQLLQLLAQVELD
jgi:hypothetical protein